MAHLPLETGSAESIGTAPPSPAKSRTSGEERRLANLTGGSRKGRPNKLTTDLKNMILGALDDAGGREYLHKQATVNPTAFMSLVGKVLPTTLVGDPKRPIVVSVTEEERRRAVDAALDAVFGVSTNAALGLTDVRSNTPLGLTIDHEAEMASANSEPQAAESVEPDDKVVQLSHIKSHTAD